MTHYISSPDTETCERIDKIFDRFGYQTLGFDPCLYHKNRTAMCFNTETKKTGYADMEWFHHTGKILIPSEKALINFFKTGKITNKLRIG